MKKERRRLLLLSKSLFDLENLIGKLVSDTYGFFPDKPENISEEAIRVTFRLDIQFSSQDFVSNWDSSFIYKTSVQFFWLLYVYA